MKRIWVPLILMLALVCACLPALADESGEITLEVNTEKLAVYEAADPLLAGLLAEGDAEGEQPLPVLVLPVKKSLNIQVTVKPRNLKNRKVDFSVDNEEVVRVKGTALQGLAAGETVLTIVSQQDSTVTLQYRVLVVTPVMRIHVTAEEKSVNVGESMALSASILPEDATMQSVIWTTTDERIGTVDEKGNVTGVKRGTVRVLALAPDGSNVRANFSVKVTQPAQEIQLDKTETTVDTGRNTMLKAKVLPADTDDKAVVWTSSDESVATVNNQGRVTGVALGDCEIVCTSKSNGAVQARATVHVQQPVKAIVFNEAPVVYVGESGQVTWSIEPANASNPAITLSSGNNKVLQVAEDGTVTGLKAGEAYVNAVTTDGTNRRARILVKVYQHVTGVQMRRNTAYIDVKETATTGADILPADATNKNMTWEVENTAIAKVESIKNQGNRVKITGVSQGDTIVTGITEDGGFRTSILVKIGDWDYALEIRDAWVEGDLQRLRVRNNSTLEITSITAEVAVFDVDGNPVPCNSKDGTNTFQMVYNRLLEPGKNTQDQYWKTVNYAPPNSMMVSEYQVTITQYQIEKDWVKVIRKIHRKTRKCPVHV